MYEALVAQVTHSAFVGEVPQVLAPDDAEGADRSQRPALRSVQLVGAISHKDELAFLPLGQVEAPRDRVSRTVGALLAFARVVVAGTASATQVRASVIPFAFRNLQISWVPHSHCFTTRAWALRA